jgi:hypothetical protein
VVRIPAEAMYVSFLQSVKAGCGAYPASSVIGIRVSFPRVERPGREAYPSFLSSTKVINERNSTSCPPIRLRSVRSGFTFIYLCIWITLL